MKKLTKWFIATFAGVSILFSSCVDQIKFGDSFLEKAPDTGDMNQDTIFGKPTMLVHSYGRHIVNCIMVWPQTGMMWMVR